MRAVFDVKHGLGYDDDLMEWHLRPEISHDVERVMSAFRDWQIIRVTKRNGGHRACLAAARDGRVERSPKQSDHFNEFVRDRLPIPNPVSLEDKGRYSGVHIRLFAEFRSAE